MNKNKKFLKIAGSIFITGIIATISISVFADNIGWAFGRKMALEEREGFTPGENYRMPKGRGFNMPKQMKKPHSFIRGNCEELEAAIDSLIEKGSFAQEKKDAVLNYLDEKEEERAAKMEELKQMTFEERIEYMKENAPEKPAEPFADMVKEGIITTQEAELIKEQLCDMKNEQRKKILDEKLSQIVEEGIITGDEKSDITAWLEAEHAKKIAEKENLKSMTEEERKEYFEQIKDEWKDPVSRMVEDGVISEDQAESLGKILPGRGRMKKNAPGMCRPRRQ